MNFDATFLVVDDFDTMRRITAHQLRQLGARRIIEAANGAEAMKILASEPVDAVISDWNMPVMSGLDLLLEMRRDARLAAVPFVMVTAEAERARVQQAIDAGVSELLVKPYTSALFADRLGRAMTRAAHRPSALAARSSAPRTAAPAERERATILVVDDTPDNLHLLTALFKDEFKVKIAHNGAKALDICQADIPPDLILLDVMMPGLDGFEVATQLRAHPQSGHLPIIFVTALNDDASRLKGMQLGAVDFVTKPVDPDMLRLRVRNFMRYIELHRDLQASYDDMMEAARLREDVEHITRHDMKGPLAGIIGIVQGLLEAQNLDGDQAEQIRMVEQAAVQTLNMINLSAEIYKIETGRFELNAQDVIIPQILARLASMARRTFAAKELDIELEIPSDIEDAALVVSGDPMLYYSLFQNLLKNACEAAPVYSTVTISLEAGDDMVVTIENEGVVPAALRPRFFEKFATAGKPGGTGLGTYSARLLAEAQGGSVKMESSDAENRTRVAVSLPYYLLE